MKNVQVEAEAGYHVYRLNYCVE